MRACGGFWRKTGETKMNQIHSLTSGGVNATERQKHKQIIRNHHAMNRNPIILLSLERRIGFYLMQRRKEPVRRYSSVQQKEKRNIGGW